MHTTQTLLISKLKGIDMGATTEEIGNTFYLLVGKKPPEDMFWLRPCARSHLIYRLRCSPLHAGGFCIYILLLFWQHCSTGGWGACLGGRHVCTTHVSCGVAYQLFPRRPQRRQYYFCGVLE